MWPFWHASERTLAENGKVQPDPTLSQRPPPLAEDASCEDGEASGGPGGYKRARRTVALGAGGGAVALEQAEAPPRAPWLGPSWFEASAEGVDAAGAARWVGSEAAWGGVWQRQVACWWQGLPGPTQQQLGSCFGALALQLGSRLDASWRTAQALLGRSPPVASVSSSVGQPGCEWIAEAEARGLSLPEAPPFPTELDFRLPPIPRLLPSYQYLQSLATPMDLPAARERTQAAGVSNAWALEPLAAGFGIGILAASVILVGGGWMRRRRAKPPVRQQHLSTVRRAAQSQPASV